MPIKRAVYQVATKADGEQGKVEALVSVFGNVDLQGDRVVKGAFKKSIAEWKSSGDPVPVIFSHDWGDLFSHIGVVDAMQETPAGLKVNYTLDIHDNPAAAQAFKLIKRRSLKEHSFAFEVRDERPGKDGANDLTELSIIEVGPTLKGANPDTEVLAVKSALEDASHVHDMRALKTVGMKDAAVLVLTNAIAELQALLPGAAATTQDPDDDAEEPEVKADDVEDEQQDEDEEPEVKSTPELLNMKSRLEAETQDARILKEHISG